MTVMLLTMAIFGDLHGFFFENVRDKASNITQWKVNYKLQIWT